MTTTLLVRRFVDDYLRNRANLVLLVLVPVVFVVVAAPALAEAGRVLGGAGGGTPLETITAGWTAGFLAATAMYFQVSTARMTDRRLVISGLPRRTLVTARMSAGTVLALVAGVAALVALAARNGIDQPWRVVAGTLMFAAIYLGFGAIVGATVRNPVNGTVLLMFIWIIDVFFGPGMSGADSPVIRALPTHFVSLWTVNLPPGHGGASELVWSLVWTGAALVGAFLVVLQTTSVGRRRRAAQVGSAAAQLRSGLRIAWRGWHRTPVLWALLAVVPAVFIWLADAITPHGSAPVGLRENGTALTAMLDPAHMHAGTMAPIAVGSLAAIAGVFIGLDARNADQRLALAGQRRWVVLATRLGTVFLAAGVATAASLAVTATVFEAHQWGVYIAANALVAMTYALIGVVIGPIIGRVSGAFVAFLIPFIDLGIGQSPMLQAQPEGWAEYLPGYGSVRVLLDGALTDTFDETRSLLLALAWVAALALAAIMLFRHERASTPASA